MFCEIGWSEGFTVFFGGGVFEDGEVGGVAGGGDAVVVYGAAHGAAGFVGVGAVAVAAGGGFAEYFGEEVSHFMRVVVNGAETFYSRGVDDVTAFLAWEGIHLRECGGVHAGVVHGRNGCGA